LFSKRHLCSSISWKNIFHFMTQKYQNFRCRGKRTGPKSPTLPYIGKIPRRNSDILEFFQVNSSDIMFHWRQIVLGINLGKILRIFLYQGVFSGKVVVQTELFAWRVCTLYEWWRIYYAIKYGKMWLTVIAGFFIQWLLLLR
jgi:hypothetical protein